MAYKCFIELDCLDHGTHSTTIIDTGKRRNKTLCWWTLLSLPELMELSTELALNLRWKHWWLFMAMSGFIAVSPPAVPVSPWLEAAWQWASFLSSSTVTGRWSLQQINQMPGAGAGLPWRHLAQPRQLDTNGESSHHLIAKITTSLATKNEFHFWKSSVSCWISARSPRCLDQAEIENMWQSDNPGQKLNISLSRTGSSYTLSLTPRSRRATPRHQAASQLYCTLYLSGADTWRLFRILNTYLPCVSHTPCHCCLCSFIWHPLRTK